LLIVYCVSIVQTTFESAKGHFLNWIDLDVKGQFEWPKRCNKFKKEPNSMHKIMEFFKDQLDLKNAEYEIINNSNLDIMFKVPISDDKTFTGRSDLIIVKKHYIPYQLSIRVVIEIKTPNTLKKILNQTPNYTSHNLFSPQVLFEFFGSSISSNYNCLTVLTDLSDMILIFPRGDKILIFKTECLHGMSFLYNWIQNETQVNC